MTEEKDLYQLTKSKVTELSRRFDKITKQIAINESKKPYSDSYITKATDWSILADQVVGEEVF
jgi:hypothetical protein